MCWLSFFLCFDTPLPLSAPGEGGEGVSGVFYAALAALVWPPDSADSGDDENEDDEDDDDDAQTVILKSSPFSSPGQVLLILGIKMVQESHPA